MHLTPRISKCKKILHSTLICFNYVRILLLLDKIWYDAARWKSLVIENFYLLLVTKSKTCIIYSYIVHINKVFLQENIKRTRKNTHAHTYTQYTYHLIWSQGPIHGPTRVYNFSVYLILAPFESWQKASYSMHLCQS